MDGSIIYSCCSKVRSQLIGNLVDRHISRDAGYLQPPGLGNFECSYPGAQMVGIGVLPVQSFQVPLHIALQSCVQFAVCIKRVYVNFWQLMHNLQDESCRRPSWLPF